MRKIYHCIEKNVSIGMDVGSNGDVKVALAFCKAPDRFQRKLANTILHGRLDSGKGDNVAAIGQISVKPIELFRSLMDTVRATPEPRAWEDAAKARAQVSKTCAEFITHEW